ncbi:MAG: hypothetical protein FJ405_17455 [Verrucomicrobia bacterium]|nr:hypothetical protein [Verrucomicrobiota bacterium]
MTLREPLARQVVDCASPSAYAMRRRLALWHRPPYFTTSTCKSLSVYSSLDSTPFILLAPVLRFLPNLFLNV